MRPKLPSATERCNDTCLYGNIDSLASCHELCRDIGCRACARDEGACLTTGYAFSVHGPAGPGVEQACKRAVQRDARCAESSIDQRCRHFARLERDLAARACACVAETPCGEGMDRCWELLPPSNLGSELCLPWDACPETAPCPAETAGALDQLSRWLREDVCDTARKCLEEPCSGRVACIEAWFDAVYPK